MNTLITEVTDIRGRTFSGEFASPDLGKLLKFAGDVIGTDVVPQGIDITIKWDMDTSEWVLYLDAEE